MQWATVVFLGIMAWAAFSISGTLRLIYVHNAQFTPDDVSEKGTDLRAALGAGDVLLVRAYGVEQVSVVSDVTDNPDGTRTVAVEPLGAR